MTDEQRLAGRMRWDVTKRIPELFKVRDYQSGEPLICTRCGVPVPVVLHDPDPNNGLVFGDCCDGWTRILCRP